MPVAGGVRLGLHSAVGRVSWHVTCSNAHLIVTTQIWAASISTQIDSKYLE